MDRVLIRCPRFAMLTDAKIRLGEDVYNDIRLVLGRFAEQFLNTGLKYSQQDPRAIRIFMKEMMDKFPVLEDYDDQWPLTLLTRIHLRDTSRRARYMDSVLIRRPRNAMLADVKVHMGENVIDDIRPVLGRFAEHILNLDLDYSHQDPHAIRIFIREMTDKFPLLNDYDNQWPLTVMTKSHLKYTSRHARWRAHKRAVRVSPPAQS
ncbi:hypothetical protein C8R43DRAFT_956025 [Mycena crocata]|nr:hypothetical protein C8R43DRAFT_956025 [Mycena crocata]